MNDLFSPHTGEHIKTDTPAAWMQRAGKAAPDYAEGESAIWNGIDWNIVGTHSSPPSPEVMSALAFIEKFTIDEQLAVTTAAMQSPELRLWYDKLMAANEVVLDDARLLVGMRTLVEHGLISEQRHDEIMSIDISGRN